MKALSIKNLSILFLVGLTFFSCKENSTSTEANMLGNLRGEKASDRFESEILKFEEADKANFPPKNAILFTGSSSIRMWENMERDMKPFPVINRGFGGSTIPEVMKYADRIVFPYEPQVIVFYAGENDIHEKTLAEITVQNFKKFVGTVQKKLPETQVIFLSMKPSIARWDEWKEFQKGNMMIKQFANANHNVHYLNIARTMLLKNEQPDTSIFIEDGLHMNEHGYVRWTALLKPMIKKMYKTDIQ